MISIQERCSGSLLLGAIGDAMGSAHEFQEKEDATVAYPFGKPFVNKKDWNITDDTQLSLVTCEAYINNLQLTPEIVAHSLRKFYKTRKLRGAGAATIKALQELEVGGHWSQVGRRGEYAAGNGAAMRIAPVAFVKKCNRNLLKEICSITHHNDEAYVGGLIIYIAIKVIISGGWEKEENLIQIIINKIPDTRIRDRLIQINEIKNPSISIVGKLGSDGYVVNSVPLAIYAATQIKHISVTTIFNELIDLGGDTDTNCSIAGQIIGAYIGINRVPDEYLNEIKKIPEYNWIEMTIQKFSAII